MGRRRWLASSTAAEWLLAVTVQLIVLAVELGSVGGSRTAGFSGLANVTVTASATAAPPENPGICASAVAIHGYKCQEFDVETDDGYILSVQRIPEGRAGSSGMGKRQPVILQHGVLVDGMTWMLNSPEQNLPMILADNGFDVWIANTRGTRFSRRHKSLDPSQRAFWDWSWDELVVHDLPAVFDFVHARSDNQKIHYVGHSLGTLIMLASLSERRLVDKLNSVALLCPVAYLSHMGTVIGDIAARSFIGEAVTLLGIPEFIPKGVPVKEFLKYLCDKARVDCQDLLTLLTGENCCLNSSTVDLFVKNEPQSTSTKNMVHLAQTVRDAKLAKYDYGLTNIFHYGRLSPPPYDLSNIPADLPMFLSYGGQDALADPLDVQRLLESLKPHDPSRLSVQYVKEYAHADHIMGINAKDVVYSQILSFFAKTNP